MNRVEIFIKFNNIKEAQLQALTLEKQLGGIYEIVFLISRDLFIDFLNYHYHFAKDKEEPETLLGRKFLVVDDRMILNNLNNLRS